MPRASAMFFMPLPTWRVELRSWPVCRSGCVINPTTGCRLANTASNTGPAKLLIKLREAQAAFFAFHVSPALDQNRIDEDPLMFALLRVRRIVHDEHLMGQSDLIGRQPNASCGIHQFQHLGSMLAQFIV